MRLDAEAWPTFRQSTYSVSAMFTRLACGVTVAIRIASSSCAPREVASRISISAPESSATWPLGIPALKLVLTPRVLRPSLPQRFRYLGRRPPRRLDRFHEELLALPGPRKKVLYRVLVVDLLPPPHLQLPGAP